MKRFPLNPSGHVTNISAYASTLTSRDEANNDFYEDLNTLMKDVHPPPPPPPTPTSDKLILQEDFSASVGTDCKGKAY